MSATPFPEAPGVTVLGFPFEAGEFEDFKKFARESPVEISFFVPNFKAFSFLSLVRDPTVVKNLEDLLGFCLEVPDRFHVHLIHLPLTRWLLCSEERGLARYFSFSLGGLSPHEESLDAEATRRELVDLAILAQSHGSQLNQREIKGYLAHPIPDIRPGSEEALPDYLGRMVAKLREEREIRGGLGHGRQLTSAWTDPAYFVSLSHTEHFFQDYEVLRSKLPPGVGIEVFPGTFR